MEFYTRKNDIILYPLYPFCMIRRGRWLLPPPHEIKFRFRDLSES